jgi:hypothetical protein
MDMVEADEEFCSLQIGQTSLHCDGDGRDSNQSLTDMRTVASMVTVEYCIKRYEDKGE